MVYVDFTAGNKDYKLRLNTRNTVALEKALGCNPLAIFGNGEEIPTITTMVSILYFSLQQLNHGISLDEAYNIFDSYKHCAALVWPNRPRCKYCSGRRHAAHASLVAVADGRV